MAEENDLSPEESDLLAGTAYDDVSFVWALIHLGIRTNPPPTPDWRPSDVDIAAAFAVFEKLSNKGLISVGRTEYIDGGPPGRHAPIRHVPETLEAARTRVQTAVSTAKVATDWEFACWIVATDEGLAVAEAREANRPDEGHAVIEASEGSRPDGSARSGLSFRDAF